MSKTIEKAQPPDCAERERALDARRSVLVRAPAGSGKTDLLTRRFLLLLGEVEDPGQIVAITFSKAAAAEMRNRVLGQLEEAAARSNSNPETTSEASKFDLDRFSMESLAHRALARSEALGWNLLELPTQLRIDTIDAFCRELALQQPLLSRLGGGLDISEQPTELYRRAARRALEQIGKKDGAISEAIEALLWWRDNGWKDVEDQLVKMLEKRDQWMHDFVLDRDPDWELLRERLERPFAREMRNKLTALSVLLDQAPGACNEVLELARFACTQTGGARHRDLAELADFPVSPFDTLQQLEQGRLACACLADLLLTQGGTFRKLVDVALGFPKECKAEKARVLALIAVFKNVAGFESALAGVRDLPPARYTDEEWRIVRACFTLLRHAAAELQVVFAEAAAADYTEVAQIAQSVLKSEDEFPTDATLAVADGIRHLLVDEFQDTSRRQHQLLAYLIAAWPEREGRTCFVVGDPMQSIYFFRDADAELFPRVEQFGLEIPNDLLLRFDPALLSANFRTAPALVAKLNGIFAKVFEEDDGSGVTFAESLPARVDSAPSGPRLVVESAIPMQLHLEFMPATTREGTRGSDLGRNKEITAQREVARERQTEEIVELIRSHVTRIEAARAANGKFRVAVLGRTKKALAPIALALREATIPFRAVELEELKQRTEIIDALALARALLNPEDRVAWLGVLRAPWCGLSLADLHTLTSADDDAVLDRPIRELLADRAGLLSNEGRLAAQRVQQAMEWAQRQRFAWPAASPGTWLEQAWLRLGGAQCVDATARANVDLLWSSLDGLGDGEPDLLGHALDAALEKLTAQPDPDANSDCGVQLMTIHKSKGLEFEVVIVPDLQAGAARGKFELLSWLERGVAEPDDEGELTEFLVAPVQSKGTERGNAKAWVDRVRCERESQELRRLLYVAATRAREELHFFARPTYKLSNDGSLQLATPSNSLLATAWSAFEKEIRERFAKWHETIAVPEDESSTLDSLAASAGDESDEMPKTTVIRRLPPEFSLIAAERDVPAEEAPFLGTGRLYERHEGGLLSRALGKAVHELLQQLARLLAEHPQQAALAALHEFAPRIAAGVRASGVNAEQASRIAKRAMEVASHAAADPIGQWILAPHDEAASEVRWTGVVNGKLRTVQVDRLFRAGDAPQIGAVSHEKSTWWIIDYKTSHEDGLDPASALPELRRIFAPQIEAYAKVLRNLHGTDVQMRAGLYYPRMTLLDWWEL
jgi:ATP-dependent helicase/nuclease subunit A